MSRNHFNFATRLAAAAFAVVAGATGASAALIGVSGPNSTAGVAPSIIGAPAHVLDDVVFNTGMQGFDEAQGVTTTMAYTYDSGVLAAGSYVDSHMIFLNSQGNGRLEHFDVVWTFDAPIIAVMSDTGGAYEAASTGELGAAGTNYTLTFGGSGPAAPFSNRGLEGGGDGYSLFSANQLQVSMVVTEPGDWIRVITAPAPVPLPAGFPLVLTGLGALGLAARRRKRAN
ncbi:VPLPA-CTERM sorting domain-containing protein [Rhodovulum marinum]|uniref:Putative secreted protein n=1 Tax=Rhodovulum marinum TaxID=320662 RepID=A0A4R2PRX2_9RHOB|nr:VPLPA-CTERM sorting domain-containing protein [Rhodovulum marinum]TCP38652.1 putative secreted protein [Rhodovulum marinum]